MSRPLLMQTITPYMPIHTMTEIRLKTSLGFSVPLLLCTLRKHLPALRGIYICIYDDFCRVVALFFPNQLAFFPSEFTSQPSRPCCLATKPAHLCCDIRSQACGCTCLVLQFLLWFSVSSKPGGHFHCRLWRHFKHLRKRDHKKLSTPAWACGVPPVRYLFRTQISCWILVCHLTTQGCSSVLLLI